MADDTAMEIDEEDDDEEITMGDVTSKGKSNEAPPLPSTPAPPTHPPLPSMPPPPAPPGTQPKPPGIPVSTPIRRDYDPKAPKSRPHAPKGPVPDEYMVSPITGERIRADKFEEHMRYGLLDPRWREQKNKEIEEKREQEEVFAAGTSVSSSLKHLAERRTDIFGQEETYIGKKVGEEDKSAKETWEGHAPSAQTGVEEQIAATLRAKGLAPDDSSARMSSMVGLMKTPEPPIQFRPPHLPFQPEPPRMPFQPPPPPPPPMAASLQQNMPVGIDMGMSMGMGMGVPMPPPSEEMPAKRSRIEQAEGDFIPEQQFIASHPGPVIIKVQVASVPDKTEWNLKGQTLSLTLPIEDLVSNIKAKLSEMLGIPPGKQKLQMGVREYTTVKAVDMLDTGIPALHNH
jgi:splicing factor 3A subunit 1